MTFISNAERIWSQGLSAVAGETANAIVLILACVIYLTAGMVHPLSFGNKTPAA
jgi:hypothetical protein